ncbi:hypothetical protein DKR52_16715 [Salmonella enterica]|uniref:PsaF/MyfF family fimbrial adhesin regulatory protein n=1 Tax=Salmonella enterica TaxID=28901 RepID=UPI0009ACB8F8|nr:PsaF/MyfF family fimbrial adhesin regulatory protein [Salmonella enterica]EDU3036420.1 hypothetical protein [Salmonella enterica subsp. enterica serovar Neudorf]EAM2494281.1 hypothetical protein [Salmonella enterica]EAQ2736415.1 hypothetical protein [Salmonella enterica]EAV3576121.1 hypothetical protein [Salmonella enterica]EAW5989213.1 hypothetical protein [Salmonella enterica]
MKREIKTIIFFLGFFALMFTIIPDLKIHSSHEYDKANEHLDIHLKWPKFTMIHTVKDDFGDLVVSETLNGLYYRNIFTGSYNMIPVYHDYDFLGDDKTSSFNSRGGISMCLYNKKNNIVIFLDQSRGDIKINNNSIHLSSLFIENKNNYHCLPKHK